jgi:hypothetical protein
MSSTNLLFVAIGAVSLLLGIGVLVAAIRGAPGTDPKSTAMLIAGMMVTAFGLLMAGFAIAYSTGGPSDLNAEAAR